MPRASRALDLLTTDTARGRVRPLEGSRPNSASATACTATASGALMARRLVEAGASLVTMVHGERDPAGREA